jgi:DNA-binding GntR family transcriptional regulator
MTEDSLALARDRGSRRTQLPEEVATYVRELIVSGAVQPGEFLRMERIAEALGVSNTPVREGLLALRSEGFVRLEPRRGFVVAPFTRHDVRDLFWAQARLGGELAARATENLTPAQLVRLQGCIDQYEVAVPNGDKEAIADIGHQFHREVNLAAASHHLALLQGAVVKRLPNRFYATIEGQIAATRREHPLLLEQFRRRDARQARAVMERHILDGAGRLIETIERQGLWDIVVDPLALGRRSSPASPAT